MLTDRQTDRQHDVRDSKIQSAVSTANCTAGRNSFFHLRRQIIDKRRRRTHNRCRCGQFLSNYRSYCCLYKLEPEIVNRSIVICSVEKPDLLSLLQKFHVCVFQIYCLLFNPPKSSGHYMFRTVVTICTTSLTFTNSTFCPHSVCMSSSLYRTSTVSEHFLLIQLMQTG